ncbi:MAG: DUF3883 domain-containing protein [Nitrospirota bacterium]
MTKPSEIINSLRNEFIQEANNAPKLFRDLAKVEQYIAESYKTRSFIELIQNADDAKSTNFGVYGFDDGLIAANNGHLFTIEDVEALCRSGSSNKFRGGNTIGYRGIGFKSVINLSKRIYVFSGHFAFYFDKNSTLKLFPNIKDVPLIRIPHLLAAENDEVLLKAVNEVSKKHEYTTLFVFWEINKRIAEEELLEFAKSSLLFLNSIKRVDIEIENIKRTITIEKNIFNNQNLVRLKEADHIDEWEILPSRNDQRDIVALKRIEESIIPASPTESVIHSFTPTVEFAGAYIKINGDYTTDPSRKNVDMDKISQKSFNNAISVIVETIVGILEGKVVKKGFFTPFVNVTGGEGSKFRGLLFKAISNKLAKKTLKNYNGKSIKFSSIRLRPDWLNYEDYERLCHSDLAHLSKDLVNQYPELPLFLEQLGIKKLYLEETLQKVNSTKLSTTGAGQIGVKIINQYRYDLTEENVKKIKNLKIFPRKGNLMSAQEITSFDEVNKDFTDYILNNVDKHDVKPFFSKLNIPVELKNDHDPSTFSIGTGGNPQNIENQTPEQTKVKSLFRITPKIQKWRSAEKNALEYFKSLTGVVSATDVSNANMGYDLEVLLADGKKIYVEIKSVSSFSEPIKITNNEYSSAHSYGNAYWLAIVINDESFQIRLIPDPIKTLTFQKQIERWSWLCDSYRNELQKLEDLFCTPVRNNNEDTH